MPARTVGDDAGEAGELGGCLGERLADAPGCASRDAGVWREGDADAAAAVRREVRRHRDVQDLSPARHREVQPLLWVIPVHGINSGGHFLFTERKHQNTASLLRDPHTGANALQQEHFKITSNVKTQTPARLHLVSDHAP